MPLIFPPSPVNGDTYTDSNSVVWQFNGTVWNVVTGTVKRLFNGVQVGLTSNYFLTTTSAAISWDLESYDTNGYWTVSQPTRLTIPATGYYNLNTVLFAPNVGAGYSLIIKKNGNTLNSTVINANQSTEYNETQFFSQGDYIEIFASETTDSGYIDSDSFVQITLLGLAVGAGVSAATAFSGVQTNLTSAFNTTTTPTAIAWDGTDFDTNANALALEYWNVAQPSRITVLTTGFYQVNILIETGTAGGAYTVTLRKNGATTVTTATVSNNERVFQNQIYQLNANDYLEILVSDTLSSGQITTESYFEIQRLGFST